MPRQVDIVVPTHQKKERIDRFLARQIENATRSKVQRAIEQGLVLVNSRPVKASHEVAPGDVILCTLPQPPRVEALPEAIPLEVVYEDDDLIVINKPAGMVTHPAYGNYTGTLVNALLHHCGELSAVNDDLRPGVVHRLDKDTSGLIVAAKNDTVHAALARQFSERTIEREYWAVVWGVFKQTRGTIEASLGRSKTDRKKVAVTKEGKHAVTEYEVIESFPFLSLLRLRLRTGRTHQIRVHLTHIGHPVFGDPTYGGRRIAWGSPDVKRKAEVQHLLTVTRRQALHAKTLGFTHPKTNQFMRFNSELPDDMKRLLAALRSPAESEAAWEQQANANINTSEAKRPQE
jgi:23S rRNA pseudouridine1911/1915/1917 synthase